MWWSILLFGCPYLTPDDVQDVDGDGVRAPRFGGGDCDDEDPTIGNCDADGDGFRTLGDGPLDCDDDNIAVFPGAPERCDTVDNDCDGLVDDDDPDRDGVLPVFVDNDGDRFGTGDATLVCEVPDGFADRDGDCNDSFTGIQPGAPEQCDGVDWNCDGDPTAGALAQWFADADGDGYGDASQLLGEGCDQPSGSVGNPDDCDDTDPDAHPSGFDPVDFTEVCDGIDNDCNGLTDGADPGLDPGSAFALFADTDGDGFGDPLVPFVGCVQDPGFVANDLDCNDADPAISPAETERCPVDGAPALVDEDCDGLVNSDDPDNDGVLWYTDADGDGIGIEAGAVPLCEESGAPGFAPTFGDCNDADGTITADVAWYPDLDGDGFGLEDPIDPDIAFSCFPIAGRSPTPGDCNDGDSAVRPGAQEICNAIDDDCDGLVDEEAPGSAFGFPDADGDGFGEAGSTAVNSCGPVAGNDSDCDDASALIQPFADEVCDGVDNDCDEDVDEDDADVIVDVWFRDADLDGFGDPDDTRETCTQPVGYIAEGTDCDDTDPGDYFGTYFIVPGPGTAQVQPTIEAALGNPGRCDEVITVVLQSPDPVDLPDLSVPYFTNDGVVRRVTIDGEGTGVLRIAAGLQPTVLESLTLRNLTLLAEGDATGPLIRLDPGATLTLDNVTLAPNGAQGPLVGSSAQVGDAPVDIALFETRWDDSSGTAGFAGLVSLDDRAGQVLLSDVALDGVSVGDTLVRFAGLPGQTSSLEVLDTDVTGVDLAGSFVHATGGVEVHLARNRVVDSTLDGPVWCAEGTTCGTGSVPTGSSATWFVEQNVLSGLTHGAPTAWYAWRASSVSVTSVANTLVDVDSGSAPFVVDGATGTPAGWVSLRDRWIRVSGDWTVEEGEVGLYETQLVESTQSLSGLGAAVLDTVAFVESDASVTANTLTLRDPVHVGGSWPYRPLQQSEIDGALHTLDVTGPECPTSCAPLVADELVAYDPAMPADRIIPWPAAGPLFRFGATVQPGETPDGGVFWQLDPNADGLPSAWIVFHASTADCLDDIEAVIDPDGDPDGDGVTNPAEYLGETWPCDPETVPGVPD